MSGWDLSEGICNKINGNISENEFWQIINNVLSSKTNKTTSYKYAFFKALIDNIFNLNEYKISYSVIFERFAEMYWNLVAKYHLSQIQATSRFSKSSVEIIIENILLKYKLDGNVVFESLKEEVRKEIIRKITNESSRYVVGAFFEDTEKSFYSFSRKKWKLYFTKI